VLCDGDHYTELKTLEFHWLLHRILDAISLMLMFSTRLLCNTCPQGMRSVVCMTCMLPIPPRRVAQQVGTDQEDHHTMTVVTDHDPVQAHVSLDIDLDAEISELSEEPLGKGAFGAVHSGVYYGHPVAVKFANVSARGKLAQEALDTLEQVCGVSLCPGSVRQPARRAASQARHACVLCAGGAHPVPHQSPQRGEVLWRVFP
jgi:hypothetical protein